MTDLFTERNVLYFLTWSVLMTMLMQSWQLEILMAPVFID